MKTLGVIGGLGPMATVYFLELITKFEEVDSDQQHMNIVMESIPNTPDRTAYILDQNKANPLPFLIASGNRLKKIGAEYLAIPCVTAHYFHEQLCRAIGLPIISIPEELGREFCAQGVSKVGLLATSGTVYTNFLQKELEKNNIDVIIPDDIDQNTIMSIIYDEIKAGKNPSIEKFIDVGDHLKHRGAEKLILGCTELSLIKKDYPEVLSEDYVDTLEVLAKATIRFNYLKIKEN